ncbi:MAG: outer membrane beta-barrel protein [bacterium]|nr:outer membrane beta-barrel protein [bacterium]
MKKHTILMTALILALAAGANAMTINGGAAWFNPSGVEGSGAVLFSLGAGQRVDDMVMANIQIDFMNKKFTKEITTDSVTTSTVSTTTRLVAYEHSVKYFPITAGVMITLPVGIFISPYVEGRVGFGIANVSYSYNESLYTIAESEQPESGTYSGFGWRIGAGGRLKLGSRSALTAGVSYNGNTCSRSAGNDVFTDLKMSGIGLGAALELSGF